jgi:glutathione S-transferase
MPVLFGLERSVYTRVARMALEEKGVPYSLEKVEIFGPDGVPIEHFRRHPFGRIPVLQHGELLLYETSAITRYVDEAFKGPALQPAGPAQRAKMNQIIGILDSYAYRPMVWGVFVQRLLVPLDGGAPDEAQIADSLQSSATCLEVLEGLLGSASYFGGESICLADLHAFPMLRYLCLVPEGLSLLQTSPALRRWYEAMLARPSVSKTASQYEPA